MRERIYAYRYEILLTGILAGVIVFSFTTLTTKPRIWYDEGINIESAVNLLRFQTLDMQTRPGAFSGVPYLIESTGYPVIAPLSLFFASFGIGFTQARIYMLLWMVAALISIFFFVKKMSDEKSALGAVVLVATFAPFYANGRTVMGEIPGFVFFLWAIYFLLWRERYLASGILFGLAIATKTSVYISIIPALIVLFALYKKRFSWAGIVKTFVGIGIILGTRILSVMPHPFSMSEWMDVAALFKNPFGAGVSPLDSFLKNLMNAPFNTTILYFSLLLAVILWIYWKTRHESAIARSLLVFLGIYGIGSFLYYLKSPGWLRYVVAAELLLLMFFVVFLKKCVDSSQRKHAFYGVILLLACVQGYHLVNGAEIFYSDSEEQVVQLTNSEFKDKTIGVFNVPEVGALIDPARKYQTYRMLGVPPLGEHPALYAQPPDIFIIKLEEDEATMSPEEYSIFKRNYRFLKTVGRYAIYTRSGAS